ncbi:chemotaxis protein CheW [Desulfobulbus alkaliphilus]|uniref:chemotaxis protein CheW n=1 Tax=Desulfobulbus alkaliphilus TaxID=869814 RepID=UPI0019636CEC|nr:chemotaxis protein CheW [Desulfobulbus alkaliphilus]MBM9536454.1 chemotaxis protein CheW [Desulfobulbus alkaliphilus]
MSGACRLEEREEMKARGRCEDRRVFLLPMTITDWPGSVFCLFSQNQIVEILSQRPIQRIPFSSEYLQGVLVYLDRLIPVICLDTLCNGQWTVPRGGYRQLVVVRTGAVDPETGEPLKVMVLAKAGVRMEKITSETYGASLLEREAPASLRRTGLLRGFYQHQNKALVLIDLSTLLLGRFHPDGTD